MDANAVKMFHAGFETAIELVESAIKQGDNDLGNILLALKMSLEQSKLRHEDIVV